MMFVTYCCFYQYISEIIDVQGQVDVIFTDLQKAFDQIDHYILLNKLNAVGLSDNLLSLISSYLIGCELFVEYGGYRSKIYIATSGVPQGSNLGPLLFSLFFNDPSFPHLMFAVDLKLYSEISYFSGCLQIQRNLNMATE